MRLTIEIDDDELRQLLAPFLQPPSVDVSPPSTRLLTVRKVAGRLGIGYSKTYELVTRGEIASISIGRSRRVSPAALAKFITTPETSQSMSR
jgi:excisionase family DNA binding protein